MADVKISLMTGAGALDGSELFEIVQAGNTRKATLNAVLAIASAYADAVAAGLSPKGAVRAATTANITLSGAQTIDGVSVIATDRVLVKNQSAGADNGIYVAAAGAWARAGDANTSAEVKAGTYCFVTEGTANGDKGFVLSTNDPITLGATALVFTQFSGVGAGVTTFLQLTDVPTDYTGDALRVVRVNAGETALEFVPASTFAFTGGTLSSALNEAPPVTIASAASVAVGAAAANTVNISGTTQIDGFDTIAAGVIRRTIFAGALQLTHHATSFKLLTGANITTAADDTADWISLGSGNWQMLDYVRKSGVALVATGSAWGAITGTLASQTDLQAALDAKQTRAPNTQTVASAATVTPTFSNDAVQITAQAVGLTLANPTGTAIDMFGMAIRVKDNGTARGITYGSQYRAIGVTLPASTVVNKTLYYGLIYNATDTKWDVLAVCQEI